MIYIVPDSNFLKNSEERVRIDDKNAENLYLCGNLSI